MFDLIKLSYTPSAGYPCLRWMLIIIVIVEVASLVRAFVFMGCTDKLK